jgi:photosynthetic reaction center cytochrome c subunit
VIYTSDPEFHPLQRGNHMKFGLSRMILGGVGTVAVCLVAVVWARGQAQQQQTPQMAEQVFKNIQVLKGIPVDEFMDTMGMFAAALSLNCIDCHTPESVGTWERFADETPLKQTARRMVQMVNAINKEVGYLLHLPSW